MLKTSSSKQRHWFGGQNVHFQHVKQLFFSPIRAHQQNGIDETVLMAAIDSVVIEPIIMLIFEIFYSFRRIRQVVLFLKTTSTILVFKIFFTLEN